MTRLFSLLHSLFPVTGALVFLLFLNLSLNAQEVSWDQVWAAEVKSQSLSDSGKVWDILRWISNRIEYETDSKYQKLRSDINLPVAERAYLDRKAVCVGFAKLFQVLCESAQIPARTVEGVVYLNKEKRIENHAWNVVKFGGKWRVVDPTWGSGHISNKQYNKQLAPEFVDMPFEERIFSHYPYDPVFQLHPQPITFEAFRKQSRNETSPDLHFTLSEIDSILNPYSELTDTSALQRSLAFKPGDLFLKQLLADEYMQIAEAHIQSCIKWYSQGPSENEVYRCQDIIRETEEWLEKSQKLYLSIKRDRKSNFKSSVDVNLQNIERNLNTLLRMKSFSP